jgi:hypothetical protein
MDSKEHYLCFWEVSEQNVMDSNHVDLGSYIMDVALSSFFAWKGTMACAGLKKCPSLISINIFVLMMIKDLGL